MAKVQVARESLKQYNVYIWSKYIELSSDVEDIDEEEALEAYRQYYAENPPASDDECYFYGLLLFEMSFSQEPRRQVEFLQKAREIFSIYQQITGDEDWEEISDRLEDIGSFLEEAEVEVTLPGDWIARLEPHQQQAIKGSIDGPEGMVWVPGGEFLFGDDEEEREIEGFYIDRYPVTNGEYQKFVEATNYRPPRYAEKKEFSDPDQPVVGVSLMDAEKYAKWAGKRLPTEEEWEKAARGTEGNIYPWGDAELNPDLANYTPLGEPHPPLAKVTDHPRNLSEYRVANMVGMVWEWTTSNHEDYSKCWVIKGGSWADPQEYISTTSRLWGQRKDKENILGFRCVMDGD